MPSDARELLKVCYPRLHLLLPSIEKAEDNQAILLSSKDSVCDACAHALGTLLGDAPIVIEADRIRKEEWRERTEVIREREQQLGLFTPGPPRRACLVTLRLDQSPDWFIYGLKSLLETSPRAFACVASANDLKKVPAILSSHFMRFKEGQRLPKPKARGRAE